MTDTDPAGPTPPEQDPPPPQPHQPGASEAAEDPGYLMQTGEAAGDDGTVVPIIGGLPAVEGSAWDIGAPLDQRGADVAGEQADPPEQAEHEQPSSS